MRARRPWIAAALSLLQPGLGHLYAGRPGLALVPSVLGVLLVASMYLGALLVRLVPLNVVLPLLLIPVLYIAVPIHAARIAKRTGSNYVLRPYNRWYVYAGFYVVLGILVIPAILEVVRERVVQAFRIPSGSMEPTIQVGDFLYVVKWPVEQRRPSRGGLVVFESVEEPGLNVVTRVVGMPGDTLAMTAGRLVRNGQLLDEPYAVHVDARRSEDPVQRRKMKEWQSEYLLQRVPDYAPDLQSWGPLVVPPDSFFGMGDNRDAAYDCRYYGFIPFTHVIGRPSVVYFSLDTRAPGSLLSRIRWQRIGHRLN